MLYHFTDFKDFEKYVGIEKVASVLYKGFLKKFPDVSEWEIERKMDAFDMRSELKFYTSRDIFNLDITHLKKQGDMVVMWLDVPNAPDASERPYASYHNIDLEGQLAAVEAQRGVVDFVRDLLKTAHDGKYKKVPVYLRK